MSDSVEGGIQDSITGAAQRVAGGAQQAAGQVKDAVSKGSVEVTDLIRAQPIVSVLVLFAVGYVLGRLMP